MDSFMCTPRNCYCFSSLRKWLIIPIWRVPVSSLSNDLWVWSRQWIPNEFSTSNTFCTVRIMVVYCAVWLFGPSFCCYLHCSALCSPHADYSHCSSSQTTRYSTCCLSVSELTHHPAYQPFQQRLFHLGGHVPQVFPTHRRKCPSSTFFKPRGSHPFSCSQVMAAVPEADCESAA